MTVIVNKRVIATLKFPTTVAAFIIYVRGIILKLTGNPNVPVPYPLVFSSLAAYTTNINLLDSAETNVQTHVSGSVAARDSAHDICKKDMRSVRSMVQQLADINTSATITSTTIITSAGLGVKTASIRKARVFAAKNTLIAGTIKVVAASIKNNRGGHAWFYTTDLVAFTGKVAAPTTTKASTTIEGLTSATKYALFHTATVVGGVNIEDGPIFMTVN